MVIITMWVRFPLRVLSYFKLSKFMKQKVEFEIDVPDGKKAVWKDGKVAFEDIKPQLPKTWKEFCNQNALKLDEFCISNTSYLTEVNIDERNEIYDRNVLPNKQAAEQHLALIQLHQLRDCYRQGWKPDCSDDSKKWCIIKYYNKPSIDFYYGRIEFLSFQTKELAEEFLSNFRDLIEQAGDLI